PSPALCRRRREGDTGEQRERRDAVEQVVRQLGAGEREEDDDEAGPDQEPGAERLAPRRARAAQQLHEERRPRQEQQRQDDQVVERPAGMSLERRREAADVVAQDEAVDE